MHVVGIASPFLYRKNLHPLPIDVDKLAITCHVLDLGVSLKLAESPVPGAGTVTFAFKYNRRVRHKWVVRIAGDKEINKFPSAGPDFGAARPRYGIGGETLV
jgi:hypothetical protein